MGDWTVVILDEGYEQAFLGLEAAATHVTNPDEVFVVMIVRDSAMPAGAGPVYTPAHQFDAEDVAHEFGATIHQGWGVPLGARVRQAEVMAAALNSVPAVEWSMRLEGDLGSIGREFVGEAVRRWTARDRVMQWRYSRPDVKAVLLQRQVLRGPWEPVSGKADQNG